MSGMAAPRAGSITQFAVKECVEIGKYLCATQGNHGVGVLSMPVSHGLQSNASHCEHAGTHHVCSHGARDSLERAVPRQPVPQLIPILFSLKIREQPYNATPLVGDKAIRQPSACCLEELLDPGFSQVVGSVEHALLPDRNHVVGVGARTRSGLVAATSFFIPANNVKRHRRFQLSSVRACKWRSSKAHPRPHKPKLDASSVILPLAGRRGGGRGFAVRRPLTLSHALIARTCWYPQDLPRRRTAH